MLADSHCHLDFSRFDTDRDAVVRRAHDAGIRIVINPGYDLESSRRAVVMAERYDGVYATVGVHPHQAKTMDEGVVKSLKDLAHHPGVVGIGEIGLDYYRDLSPRDVQREAMRRQLQLAAEMEMPVVVHSREAHEDVMFILAEWASSTQARAGCERERGVLHAFSGDWSMAREAWALGFYTGVAGPVTFASAQSLQGVVRGAPLERLLMETDAPYLTPHPYRGKRNEPALVALVCATIAELKRLAPREVAQVTTANCRRLFELRPESPDNRPQEEALVESR